MADVTKSAGCAPGGGSGIQTDLVIAGQHAADITSAEADIAPLPAFAIATVQLDWFRRSC